MSGGPAEHARFHGYIRALSQVAGADERDLVRTFLTDPDHTGHPAHRSPARTRGSTSDLADASNWLQRKVAERAHSPRALATLAEHGRTNRVRATARSRFNQLPD